MCNTSFLPLILPDFLQDSVDSVLASYILMTILIGLMPVVIAIDCNLARNTVSTLGVSGIATIINTDNSETV